MAVVVLTPASDEDLSFFESGENFAVQKLVPKLAIKRFRYSRFPKDYPVQ